VAPAPRRLPPTDRGEYHQAAPGFDVHLIVFIKGPTVRTWRLPLARVQQRVKHHLRVVLAAQRHLRRDLLAFGGEG